GRHFGGLCASGEFRRDFSDETGRLAKFRGPLLVAKIADALVVDHGIRIPDLLLDVHEGVKDSLGARWATGDVAVHRHKVVASLHDAVAAVHSARRGASPHGDAPFWIGHLIPYAPDGMRHLVRNPSGHDHQVGLPR